MAQQKVIQVGNSLAVTLPKYFVNSKKLRAGQNVFVEADPDLDLIQVRTKETDQPQLTPEFKKWLDDVVVKYEETIKALAKA